MRTWWVHFGITWWFVGMAWRTFRKGSFASGKMFSSIRIPLTPQMIKPHFGTSCSLSEDLHCLNDESPCEWFLNGLVIFIHAHTCLITQMTSQSSFCQQSLTSRIAISIPKQVVMIPSQPLLQFSGELIVSFRFYSPIRTYLVLFSVSAGQRQRNNFS